MEHLSPREFVVVRLVTMGNSDEEIASKLRLSAGAIEKTLASIYAKLGISSREQIGSARYQSRPYSACSSAPRPS